MIGLEFLHQLETSPQGAIGFAMGRRYFAPVASRDSRRL
jgi:hypothetical protein